MDNHKLQEVVVQCSNWTIRELKTEGYTIVRSLGTTPETWEFRVTDRNQFLDRFLNITNRSGNRL